MRIVTSAAELAPLRGSVFVPTMGALHAGHRALIEHATRFAADRPVVVSIFVNPTQFAPGEDFERYPRPLEADLAAVEESGGEFVFAPSVATMYPEGLPDRFEPLPRAAIEPQLEERYRPQFFHGVCTVVKRLFDLVQPSTAIFGEKDYQQLLVIREMVRLLGMEISIEGRPTERDSAGLALSSRNVYLSGEERLRALGLSRALAEARSAADPRGAEAIMQRVLTEHELAIDYAVVRDAETLMPIDSLDSPSRALVAARLGTVRLIDNAPIG